MNVNVSCKTGESSIACAAVLHVAAVVPEIAWGLTPTNAGLRNHVTAHSIPIDRGCADVLDRPGLGIVVGEDRVSRHRVASAVQHEA
jgi:L-alanine-DL-glutamate epimerase-like enolase superfamily enzyme